MQRITKTCTEVLFTGDDIRPEQLVLVQRHINPHWRPTQRVFRPAMRMTTVEIREIVQDLMRGERRQRMEGEENGGRRERIPWRDQVNMLRERIWREIEHSPASSMKEIAREVCCNVATVKGVMKQYLIRRGLKPYDYEAGHSNEVKNRLERAIQDPTHMFWTTSDYKRVIPQCSKRYIAKTLKSHGLKYVKTRRERREPVRRQAPWKEIKRVVWPSIQAFARNDETLLYLDEAEFPLVNSSEYCWARPDDRPLYNRRPAEHQSLHLIALCSQQRMVAIQIHTEHPNAQATLYFLTTVLDRVNRNGRVMILLDNAGWHLANLVKYSAVYQFLLFNVSRYWELNLIELTFAKAKDEWRRRSLAQNLQEEVETLAGLFMGRDFERDFGGYRRMYLRRVLQLL